MNAQHRRSANQRPRFCRHYRGAQISVQRQAGCVGLYTGGGGMFFRKYSAVSETFLSVYAAPQ
ncbi:hypothetical protein ACTXT7_002131 [Hymenolepis weldensis]